MIIFGPPYKVELPPEQIHFITGLTVNTSTPHTFTPDSGFPYTAFAGAFYQTEIDDVVPATGDYTFSVSDPALSVSNTGVVTFNSEPSGSEIVITITPADGSAAFMYTFMPGLWFAQPTTTVYNLANAEAYILSSMPGFRPCTQEELSGLDAVGTLYGEWSKASSYPGGLYPGRVWCGKGATAGTGRQLDLESGSLYQIAEGNLSGRVLGVKILTA
ncbi:hypothetical protein KD923_22080 [Escherichia fergusonii]|nr:hypothetical protein [Escherichia fergusonii]MCH5362855.1 hypothetical protein [Escherichia fergusonii]